MQLIASCVPLERVHRPARECQVRQYGFTRGLVMLAALNASDVQTFLRKRVLSQQQALDRARALGLQHTMSLGSNHASASPLPSVQGHLRLQKLGIAQRPGSLQAVHTHSGRGSQRRVGDSNVPVSADGGDGSNAVDAASGGPGADTSAAAAGVHVVRGQARLPGAQQAHHVAVGPGDRDGGGGGSSDRGRRRRGVLHMLRAAVVGAFSGVAVLCCKCR